MGRKRQFQIEEALDQAARVFWAKGYDGASLTDLTDAMGIAPTSLYFAFGNKEALFRRVIERYNAMQADHLERSFREPTVRDAVRYLLRGYVLTVTDPLHAPGCLLINSSRPDLASSELRQWLAGHRSALRLNLEDRFSADQTLQKIGPSAAARFVVSVTWGLALEAQAGASQAELLEMVDVSLVALPSEDADH